MKLRKNRLDVLLKERGLAPTREKAQALILAGRVFVKGQKQEKSGVIVEDDVEIEVKQGAAYVSRGAYKLLEALDRFEVHCNGKNALDVGASTGGFTQVLLERGAARVTALDVGHNQLDWKIRSDPRVRVIEKTNARHLGFETLGEIFDIIVIDVSFISLDLILPPLRVFASAATDWITLIKPQFEVGKEKVEKGGIVRDDLARREAIERITAHATDSGFERKGLIESPILGGAGNKEYLAHWRLKP